MLASKPAIAFSKGSNPLKQKLLDYTNYDPWGIELNGTGLNNPVDNRFKYQSKESLTLFGLSGINDFGARYYDKTVGRWWGVDPLSEVARRWTTFAYAFNNPIRFIDPDGMAAQTVYDFNGNPHRIGDNDVITVYQAPVETQQQDDGGDRKTVMVAFGGLDAKMKGKKGVAGEIVENLNQWANKNNKSFVGKAVSSSWKDSKSLREAIEFIRENYTIGSNDKLIIYGFSWGGGIMLWN